MLFMRDQRPNYAAQIKINGCVAISAILGQKWKSLSDEEQAEFYKQADREKRLQAQRHPGWTAADNFGVRKGRRMAAKLAEAWSATREVTQQAKELTDDMPAPPDVESGDKANGEDLVKEVEAMLATLEQSDLQPSDFCPYRQ
ncbi:lymphoid enhancer-binding factor 1-like [Cyclopterus lumpus]|uniref:lymphoid enhancer-binding factor 1-like n=1 Tax=Cyclopterus lumpus TaxID=8103 RepID=UPI001485EAEB|nr:lymphoid enhancer-binding factor 1-like [Cyclopterus lumpus]